MHRPWALILAGLTACAGPAATHVTTPSDSREPLRALAGSALLEPQGASMLQVLSEEIGPRIPGTDACTRAENYVAERMRAAGMSNVHLEEVQLPDRWEPGDVWLELPKIHTPEDAFAGISPALLASSAATHAVLLHQLLDADAPLAPRLGPEEVRVWVSRERFEPDAWMMDRGDLLGAR